MENKIKKYLNHRKALKEAEGLLFNAKVAYFTQIGILKNITDSEYTRRNKLCGD